MYDSFCSVYYKEMNERFRSINIIPGSKTLFRKSIKLFWHDNLQSLWVNLCKIEKKCMSSPQGTYITRTKLVSFRVAQKSFDGAFRKAKRKYDINTRDAID